MNLIAEKTISFEEAIALTQKFIEQIKTISETEKEKIVSSLVASENGARGFTVTYLTSDHPSIDQEFLGIINGLKTSPQIVSELLVKHVAMSTGMRLTHQRNNDENMANKSFRVTNRTINLLKKLDLAETKTKIQQLKETIDKGEGIYQKFLTRWQYDSEQKEAIAKAFD